MAGEFGGYGVPNSKSGGNIHETADALRAALDDPSLVYEHGQTPDRDEAFTRKLTGRENAICRLVNAAILRRAAEGGLGFMEDIVLFEKVAACKLIPDHIRRNPRRLGMVLARIGFRRLGTMNMKGIPRTYHVREIDGEVDPEWADELVLEAKEAWGVERKKAVRIPLEVRKNMLAAANRAVDVDLDGKAVVFRFATDTEAWEFFRKFGKFMEKAANAGV